MKITNINRIIHLKSLLIELKNHALKPTAPTHGRSLPLVF